MPPKRTQRRVTPARILLAAAACGALWFAVFAGEYSTVDLFRQRSSLARLTVHTDSIQRIVDSLRKYRKAIETDPAVQERIAREEFGMVKGSKELLYRFSEPDSADRGDSVRRSP